MQHLVRSILLLSLLSLTACDAAETCVAPVTDLALADPAGGVDVDAISYRDLGPPQGLYVTQFKETPIKRAHFVALINACKKHVDPDLTCTLSWYQPDTSQPERVLGLGCSMMASYDLWTCYVETWQQQNPVAF